MSTDTEVDFEMEDSYKVLTDFKSDSELEDSDAINVDYDFFDRVSSQLYRNPRRAVEELVCNSYDAGAWECHVVTPNNEDDRLYVLDNGASMDDEGFKDLWKIADSPKKRLDEDPNEERYQHGRQQIGKFGIGKLAAFAVGEKLTHVATSDGRTRAVTVAKRDIDGRDTSDPPRIEIFGQDEDEAKDILETQFEEQDGLINPWEQDGDKWEDWTLAIVDDIKPESLEGGAFGRQYLGPMIRTAIPLSTDFDIYLNGREIETREEPSDSISDVVVGEDEEFKRHLEGDLREFWIDEGEYDDSDDVPSNKVECDFTEIEAYEDSHEPLSALDVPELGPVSGSGAIYEDTLTSTTREKKDVQDYGYRLLVRGKLVNRGEPLFDTPAKSHKYWNRFFAEIEIPELDESILLQRDSIEEHGIEPKITRVFLDSLFNYLRADAKGVLESDYDAGAFFKRLSTLSPHKAPEALQGLVDSEGGDFPTQGWDSVEVEFAEFETGESLADYKTETDSLRINLNHPLLKSLDEKQFPETSREVVGEALAGYLLATGYLHANNVPPELIDGSKEIMERSALSAAKLLQDRPNYYERKLEDTASDGGDPHEMVVVDCFRNIGVSAEHIGGSSDPDGVVELSLPTQNFRAALEIKGGDETDVDHADARAATMRRHKNKRNCDVTVLVGKYDHLQIRGQGSPESDSDLLEELNEADDVTVLTQEALIKILNLHREYPFDYTKLKGILLNQATVGEHERVELTNVRTEGELFHETTSEDRPKLGVDELPELVEEWWEKLPREESEVETILEAALVVQTEYDHEESKPSADMVMSRILDLEVSKSDVEAVLSSAALTGYVKFNDNKEYEIIQSTDVIMDEMRR